MDLSNIGKAEDRISKLPDSLLHHILSFLDIKPVARNSVLSKRWKYIWTSIPTLVFPFWSLLEPPSLSGTSKFMEFVDRTLLHHDASNIQKFRLETNEHMSAYRVHSWIQYLTRHNVEKLNLWFHDDRPFIPLSLFTCESLIKLNLTVKNATHLPVSFCFPKLKSLTLCGFQFTGDCWNEQHFSKCPVLESLALESCTWFDVRNFCISIPTLKLLQICYLRVGEDGLRNCALKIDAPNLVSLTYPASVAKEYVLSSFQTLEFAEVFLGEEDGVQREQSIGYGAAILSIVDDFVNILPHILHDMDQWILKEGSEGKTTDKSLFLLLKAVPNLRWLEFEESCIDYNREEEEEEEDSWAGHLLTAGCLFQHLESVSFTWFNGNPRQMRWVKLILKNAKALRTILIDGIRAESKEVIMTELLSLPRASDICEF